MLIITWLLLKIILSRRGERRLRNDVLLVLNMLGALWESPWAEEPGRLPSMATLRHDRATNTFVPWTLTSVSAAQGGHFPPPEFPSPAPQVGRAPLGGNSGQSPGPILLLFLSRITDPDLCCPISENHFWKCIFHCLWQKGYSGAL